MNINDRVPHSRQLLSVAQIPPAPPVPRQLHTRLHAVKDTVGRVTGLFRDLGLSYITPFGRAFGIVTVDPAQRTLSQGLDRPGPVHAPSAVVSVPARPRRNTETSPLLSNHSIPLLSLEPSR